MSEILQDLRFGVRMLRKRPGTSALAIVALALGIGLTTTMFSIVQGAFLRGLPFEESERIMHLGRVTAKQPDNIQSVPIHDYVDWRASQQSFDDLGAFGQRTANVTGGLAPERYRAAAVTPNMLRILHVAPALGRDFTDADGQPGAVPVAIVSHRIWQSQFERDPSIIGRVVRINGTPTSIIGVLPPRFGFPQTQDLWLPLQVTLPAKRGEGDFSQVFGRLKPSSSMEQAAAEMVTIAKRLEAQYSENKDLSVRVTPYVRRFIGTDVINTLLAMLGAVFGVMLIACANVTNLQLARAAERTREVAVRTALGAGRARIIRQMLLEGLLLSAAGAALGLGIAGGGIALFNRAIVDTNPPFWIDIRIDTTVLLFVTALTVVATLAASLVPSLRATRQDVHAVLKDEGRANTGLRMGRFGRSLVIAEVLLSCCLLVVSGLMIKSVTKIGTVRYPYGTEDVFVGGISADAKKYPAEADRAQLAERLEAELRSVPGARQVALSTGTPENAGGSSVALEGQTFAKPEDKPSVRRLNVSPAFFEVLRVAVSRGRMFTAGDVAGSTPVAIVSDDFARKFYPNADPLGGRLQFGNDPKAPLWTIVGIAPKLVALRTEGSVETVYTPLAQVPVLNMTVLALTTGSPTALSGPVRQALLKIDEDLALANPNSLAASYWRQTWAFRVFGALFMSFGVAALTLAAAGLYGVMAFSVRRRTQEIGVRMALGAGRGGVVRMILWQGMWRVALGIALGLAPAWWLGGLMRELLFNVKPGDPLVFATTIVCLLIAGFVASLVPAMRAASVDPLVALRHD